MVKSVNYWGKTFHKALVKGIADYRSTDVVLCTGKADRNGITNKFDVSFLLKFRLFNISGKVFTTPDGIHLSIQDMQKLEYYENIENMCNKAVRLQEQLLSLDEILVLASIALLFTGSRFEVWLLTMYRCFDIENSLFTAAGGLYSGGTVHMDDICKCYDTEFIESMFNRAGQLQNYNLDESEINTLKAVILLFRDRCALQCPDKVEHYQAIMVEALQELLKKNHPKDPLLFPRLLVFLMDLRSLTELHAKNIEKVHLEFNDIQFPPLLYEML